MTEDFKITSGKPQKIISAGSLNIKEYFGELVQYRHLIWVFALQEIKAQYVQTRLSLIWVVLRPLMVLALFTFIFDRLIKIPGLMYPYPLFAFSGLLVWNNFSYLVNTGGNVIMSNHTLVKKIYFPRIILLLSKLLISLVELGVSLLLMFLLMAVIGYPVSLRILLLPVFLSISILAGLTIAVWLSALTIKHRDFHQFVPTLIGFMIWLTPVFYPVTLIPRSYSFVVYLNPISAAIQGCRWAILGDTLPSLYYLPVIVLCSIFFIIGLLIFIRSEGDLVDYI
jgi:lipopolysaccharide transport system permease protein